MALQMSRALAQYGAQGQIGKIVSITLVRELGPVLTALLVAGRQVPGDADAGAGAARLASRRHEAHADDRLPDQGEVDLLVGQGAVPRLGRGQRGLIVSPPKAGKTTILNVLAGLEHLDDRYLRAVGYATGCFGKWNIGFAPGSRPTERGFDEFLGFRSGNIGYYEHLYGGEYDLHGAA